MSCECSFNLFSRKFNNQFPMPYGQEQYQIPCSAAVSFLRQLDSPYNDDTNPLYKINYTITDGNHRYASELQETPAKAAAKIELFMKNPKFMPEKK